jgi:hypothetical protein
LQRFFHRGSIKFGQGRIEPPEAYGVGDAGLGVSAPSDAHYEIVCNRIKEGRVIPFLGAGASLCDRPPGVPWEKGRYLPSGSELAAELADKSRFPDADDRDLLRVSQYLDAQLGEGGLYDYVREVFDAPYPFNSLHRLLASLPPLFRAQGIKQPLIVTTNYDDALERAFDEKTEPYDLVWYEAKRSENWGRFLHLAATANPVDEPRVVQPANTYPALARDDHPVILKLHGAVQRDSRRDSYVITEDSYIDYLSQGDISDRIPIKLLDHMSSSHFLFLGYSLRDWNLRVILNRIWGARPVRHKSWAIQLEPKTPALREIEETLWRDRGDVEPVYARLEDYVARLGESLLAVPAQVGP